MSTIKRYLSDSDGGMDEHPVGDYVTYECYAALERQRDELLTIVERIAFAADAKLLSEKHRVVEEARAAIANAKRGVE